MGPICLWDSCWPSVKSIITVPAAATFVSFNASDFCNNTLNFFYLPGGDGGMGGGGGKLLALLPTSRKTRGSLFVWSLPFNLFDTGGPTRNTRLQST